MARKKASDGVVATIERLTGKIPCPMYLRQILNKYLYQEELFEGAKSGKTGGGAKRLGHLHGPDTDSLVRNLLDLDALFRGETNTVKEVIMGTITEGELQKKLTEAEHAMQQRVAIYTFWLDRLSSVRKVLAAPRVNLKVDRLDEKLLVTMRDGTRTIPPFALHALQVQEASETKGRVGLPSASEYVERAEAYLALDDLTHAERNACSALEQDVAYARAWFIRVAIALRRRQSAMRTFNQKRMEAQECAEPLSAHERWATEQADEAAGDVWQHQQSLDAILPQAILNWPRADGRRDHANLWNQVRNLFVDRMFSIAVHDVQRAGTRQQWAYLNGLEPEWELEHQKHPYASSTGLTGSSPFIAEETQAIAGLLAEYDDKPRQFFDAIEDSRIATDFRLFHLRYVLRMEGGNAHWARLQSAVDESPMDWKADYLMREPTVAKLWQMHFCRNDHASALMQSYAGWLRQTRAQRDGRLYYTVMRQYAYLYHYQFARRQFSLCSEVAENALALFDGATELNGWFGGEQHPYDNSISMPLHQARYWEYLAALAAVEQRKQGGGLSARAEAILGDESRWRKAFSEQTKCFWTESEEYEEGGGEDWPEPPYGIDLREPASWASEAQPIPAE
jgi:hypothetical protein